ncbi:MAG: ABC transporter substrate-binding protein [Candidatus Nanopelagicaceae bacterium]
MKRSQLIAIGALSALVLSLLSVVAPAQAARDLKGKKCGKEGLVRTISGVTYTCERVNGNLQYAQGRKLSGTLNVLCTPQELWCVEMTKAFQAKTGITTKFIRLSSGEALTRLVASKGNPEFDVWTGGPNDSHIAGRIAGVLDTYKSPTRNMLKSQFKDDEGYWTGIYMGALGFCSNTNELKRIGLKAPTSWNDLLNPKYKGNIMMAHPGTSGTAYTALWSQVLRLGSEDKAIEYMQELNKNILSYTRSGAGPTGPLGRGEVATGLVFSHDCTAAILRGNPLVVSFPKEGTGFEIGGIALVKGARNPDAAKAYIDFALSAEAQNIGPAKAESFQILTNPNAKYDRRMVNLKKVTLLDYQAEAAGVAASKLKARFDKEVALTSSAK